MLGWDRFCYSNKEIEITGIQHNEGLFLSHSKSDTSCVALLHLVAELPETCGFQLAPQGKREMEEADWLLLMTLAWK